MLEIIEKKEELGEINNVMGGVANDTGKKGWKKLSGRYS